MGRTAAARLELDVEVEIVRADPVGYPDHTVRSARKTAWGGEGTSMGKYRHGQ
jgi:hypothetical protein